MEIYNLKLTNEPVLMVIKSKEWQGINNLKTGEILSVKTLNLIRKLDGSLIAIGDDEIEFLKTIEE